MAETPANLNADGTFECDGCGRMCKQTGPFVQIAYGPGASELRCGDPIAMRWRLRHGTELAGNEDCVGDDYWNDEATEAEDGVTYV
mgnify:CR=1 FL=1